ncbi:MAG: glycosyl hydrolase, partial [Myxococcota bacterium]|nr:glycosyl hydrolase [Myxococcota bacterium]
FFPIPLSDWENPPMEVRPMARWWWPGGSVQTEKLAEQIALIKEAGFGGVEIQPLLLGLGETDLASDAMLRTVGQPDFFQKVARAAELTDRAGLFFDLTLGSGWPGGLPTSPRNAERQLLMANLDLEGPSTFQGSLPPVPDQSYRDSVEWVLDVLGPPDPSAGIVVVLAGQLGAERDGLPTLLNVREITDAVEGSTLHWDVPPGAWRVMAFYTNSTGHFVMGGAFPGEEADALVVDHLSVRGADALLEEYGAAAIDPLPEGRVRGVFVDSFELMGELPFTSGFRAAFKKQAGYDVTPYLPLLFRRGGESKYAEMIDFFGRSGGPIYLSSEAGKSERIREDYEAVRRSLFESQFVARFAQWARARGLEFRLQAHGGYGDYLDTYALADVPESEGLFGGGSFDFLKLASSAAHVSDRRWASSEAFITLQLFKTRLSDEEMRLLAGRAYSAGINRLVYHGIPYPYTRADGEAWFPFSGGFGRILAGPFPMSSRVDEKYLAKIPAFNAFLARLSVAMSQGKPVAEVAWLRADPIYPDAASLEIGKVDPGAGESVTTRALRARGLVHDRVSRKMLMDAVVEEGGFRVGARSYRALLIDPLAVAEPELVEQILVLGEAGIPIVALGELPVRAPGLRDAKQRDKRVRVAVGKLNARVLRAQEEKDMEPLLQKHVRGLWVEPLPGESLTLSLESRETKEGHILFVFNESWSPTRQSLRITRDGSELTLWDPWTGERRRLKEKVSAGESVELEMQGAESMILTLNRSE